MFFSQSEAILSRIRDHLSAWRADGANVERLAALQDEFDALKSGATHAGFDDVAELGTRVAKLLGQSGEAVGADDEALLNLLEEVHDGLVADIGFVPSVAREQIKTLNGLVVLLLRDAPPASSVSDVPMCTFAESLSQLRGIVEQVAEGKQVELNGCGDAVEAQQAIVELVTKLLERVVRHTIAHRVASAEQRSAGGKDAVAHINIAIVVPQRDQILRDQILINYSDDGESLDATQLAADAVAAGMTHDVDGVDETHWLQILARADEQSNDAPDADSDSDAASDADSDDIEAMCRALRDDIKKLGGLMVMKSAQEGGVHFQFRLPTSIDARALLVTVGQYRFALPAHIIERVLRVRADEVVKYETEKHQRKYICVDQRRIPIIDRATFIGEREVKCAPPMTLLVLLRLADRFAAVEVDAVHDLVELSPEKPGAQLASIRGIVGVAQVTRSGVSADFSMALMVDPDAFIHREVLEQDGLTQFPLCETQSDGSPTKTKRVVLLETSRGTLVIPATMVAEIVSTPQSPAHESKHEHEHEWISGDFLWRGCTVPLINNAVVFADVVDDADDTDDAERKQTKHGKYAVILLPMKERQPDEFFALCGFAAPSVIEIDDQAVAPDTGQAPQHLLGYVQLEQRLGLVPDLNALAHGIFHDH